jgi:ABC-type antimicrobial peptide transport system permease subunit
MVGRREHGVVYLPFEQQPEFRLVFSARAATDDPLPLVGVLRSTILTAEPDLAIAQLGTADSVASPPNLFAQVSAMLAGVLGVFALLVSLAGLGGMLSQFVTHRTREIGVRMALGARPAQVHMLVVGQGLSPIALGVLAGAGLGLLARGSLQPWFSRLLPAPSGWLLLGVPCLFLIVGTLACYLPASRAASVEPNSALRTS